MVGNVPHINHPYVQVQGCSYLILKFITHRPYTASISVRRQGIVMCTAFRDGNGGNIIHGN